MGPDPVAVTGTRDMMVFRSSGARITRTEIDRMSNSPHTIGLTIGAGTGAELADVFCRVALHIAGLHNTAVTVNRSTTTFESYHSIRHSTSNEIAASTLRDASSYDSFCQNLRASGVRSVFRTAMNAHSLYLARQRMQAVKVDRIATSSSDVVLVRDQLQGFYTGANTISAAEDCIQRSCTFSRILTRSVVEFALGHCAMAWRNSRPDRILMIYKFHLLDGLFERWVRELAGDYGIAIELCQPDTANRNLLRADLTGNSLIVGSNEWADIMHAILLSRFGLGSQDTRFTRNAFLRPDLVGLTEYQTVHGSADDLAGRNVVNPVATIRAAAAVMEETVLCYGAAAAMEHAIDKANCAGVSTPDVGGTSSTTAVVDYVLGELDNNTLSPMPGTQHYRRRSADVATSDNKEMPRGPQE
jgi:tartrate dehydrogenase/decarboxylase/D-malate dehydrogenase